MPIQPGEFWVADIPFTDGSGSKKRPVLVLWLDGRDTVVTAVTSAAPRSPTDVPLTDWRSAGLRVPSTVRLARLDCLEQVLLIHKLGMISAADATQVKAVWSTHVKPAF
jgi:mRNA interferase MazF